MSAGFGVNSWFEEELYRQFLSDPGAVDRDWRQRFNSRGPQPAGETAREAAILQLIHAYRVRGHLIANLDPLGSKPGYHPELDPEQYGFTSEDLDREFLTGTLDEALGGEGAPRPVATLRQILETLRRTYCGTIGCEYMHIQVPAEKRWVQQAMESGANTPTLEAEARRRTLAWLFDAEEFEHLLHARFVGHKRFSLEGAETAIAILNELVDRAAENGVQEIVLGMAHRGRLNVLNNVVGKSLNQIFSEFEGVPDPASIQGSGDVKYHLGASGVRQSSNGSRIRISLAPNPSHLESCDPVVEGMARLKQDRIGGSGREVIVPILVHGDAAFAGQGVVQETLNLSQLEGYRTGGTIHLIVNNQIGFTAVPEELRSSPYSTDVARMVQAPIFHVNGDDPDAALRAARMAFDFRQRFEKDVVVDMLCYRRHGHNEADDPSYTQPVLYRKIKEHPSVAVLYAARLAKERAVAKEESDAMRKGIASCFAEAFDERKPVDWFEAPVGPPAERTGRGPAALVGEAVLRRVSEALATLPPEFHPHPKLRSFLDRRREAVASGGPIDWALAEALAFGTLVLQGTPVRLSGQDSSRGAFSQRHLILYDTEDGHEYCPLGHVAPEQARFEVYDSSLSEYGVLGFEFGYSVADLSTLVLWEAQFGDFANGAQIVIDQFITASESKWRLPCGLVLLLPHGYEGQGPEHSSGRIERFLELSAEDNLQVVNCTTPAQYFHVLRRQMRENVGKPLVIFTPKSLLRHHLAVSLVDELTGGKFQEVLGDAGTRDAERVLLCSGKIYYELLAEREKRKASDVAIVRVEQLYPFPEAPLLDILGSYSSAAWVQEEPRNMGAWRFIQERIKRELRYVGRPESASPATGSYQRHQQEQAAIVEDAFTTRGRTAVTIPKRKAG